MLDHKSNVVCLLEFGGQIQQSLHTVEEEKKKKRSAKKPGPKTG